MDDFELMMVRALKRGKAGQSEPEKIEPEPDLTKSNLEWWFKNSYTFLDIDALTRLEVDNLMAQIIKIVRAKNMAGIIPDDNFEKERILHNALVFTRWSL